MTAQYVHPSRYSYILRLPNQPVVYLTAQSLVDLRKCGLVHFNELVASGAMSYPETEPHRERFLASIKGKQEHVGEILHQQDEAEKEVSTEPVIEQAGRAPRRDLSHLTEEERKELRREYMRNRRLKLHGPSTRRDLSQLTEEERKEIKREYSRKSLGRKVGRVVVSREQKRIKNREASKEYQRKKREERKTLQSTVINNNAHD